MKKYTTPLFSLGLIAFVMVMASFGGDDTKSSGGAPAGYTNSPADGQNCSHCMGGTASPVTGWITSNIPATGYEEGQTYTITVTATGTGRKGFQVSPQNPAGDLIGTLTSGAGNKLVGSNKYVTHSSAQSVNPATWDFEWTAPAEGSGAVTFYGSVIVGAQNTKTTTMTVSQSTVGVEESGMIALRVFPNPVRDRVSVAFSMETEQPVAIDLLNLRGEWVASLMQESCPSGEFARSFPVSQSAGSYLLRLNAGGKSHISKLIIAD